MLSLRLGIAALQGISNSGGGFDPDAEAFFTAAGITDPTQQTAVNQLVLDLKGYSIWTKMKAIYPIVGGNASSHAVNLKTPGTYNLTFSTGWTHSNTGAKPNGTSAYADTQLATNTMSNTSIHLSFYSRTIGGTVLGPNQFEIGSFSPAAYILINSNNLFYASINTGTGDVNTSNTDTHGFYIGNRNSSATVTGYKNDTKVITSNFAASSANNYNLYISAFNNANTAAGFSSKQCAFSSIGDGLTDTEAANFYTAVQAYQTTLGRQV